MSIKFMGLTEDTKLSVLGELLSTHLNNDQDMFKQCMRNEIERIYNKMKEDENVPYKPASIVPCAYMVHAVLFMALGKEKYHDYIDPAEIENKHKYPYNDGKNSRPIEFSTEVIDNLNSCHDDSLEDIVNLLESVESENKRLEKLIGHFNARTPIHFNIAKSDASSIGEYMTKQGINNNAFAVTYMKYILASDFMGDYFAKIEIEIHKHIGNKYYQLIFTGAPGTGKTYGVRETVNLLTAGDKSRSAFVQFHSSYDYTDFVEGLRPAVIGKDDSGKPIQAFVRMDGAFKKFCRIAAREENKYMLHFFIIDEINRADLSRVFGELMYCFENRGKEHEVETQYAGLPTYHYSENGNNEIAVVYEDDIYRDKFYIPENVVVIGTMNDIDRSVETFDYALRRRFKWIEVTAEESLKNLSKISDAAANISKNAIALNNEIAKDEYHLGKEFQLGMAYFKDYKGGNLDEYFKRELSPILREYMRGRPSNDKKDFIDACEGAFTGKAVEKQGEQNGNQ